MNKNRADQKYPEFLLLKDRGKWDSIYFSAKGVINKEKNRVVFAEIPLDVLLEISRKYSMWNNYFILADDYLCRIENIKINFKNRKVDLDFSTMDVDVND
ncbi:hypothetical protein ACRS7F_24415 [Brucella anthropi]|uniref:hypothetical protein n=1 Tax=Brucella anthropi TaxID=529 RepID=UPI000E9B0CFD|nr:hypothetical protein [Brucella anthropi]KAB2784742.1 hypothetical protein F9K96_24470 [Brucella anthropi]QOD67015.1 hypothetical protein HGK82_24060 [Ochrobactrum sp. MT180101]HBQ31641.1 hypothetical protein [Brucella anthropi]